MGNWVTDIIKSTGYFGITALMLIENVFPPIPSEVIMPLAGYLVSQNQLDFIGAVAAGTLGTVLGALPFYWLGYHFGPERLKCFCDRHGRWFAISRQDVEKTEDWFARHGIATVFFLRLVPGLRSLISIPAGFSRMSFIPFLLFTTLGSALWATALTAAGYLLGSQFSQTGKYIGPVSTAVIAVLVIWYIWRVIKGGSAKEH